ALALALASSVAALPAAAEPRAVYHERCASCHGPARYGGYAPPLIPAALERKSDGQLVDAIRAGLANTQMPGFAEVLDEPAARSLVSFLREPVGTIRWDLDAIAASRLELPAAAPRIPPEIRRDNLILVVERGTSSVSVLDGDSLGELDRFEVGRIHGGPKFDRALRMVFAATRDGTVVKYDLAHGGLRAKVKVAVNTRNIAASPDGAFVAAANQLPATLVVLDGALRPQKVFPLPGQPSGVYAVPGRDHFLLALRDLPRLLRVTFPELELREVALPEAFEDFTLVPDAKHLVASARGGQQLLLYDLDADTVRAALPTQGLPHLFSSCFFERDGVLHAAFNHIGIPRLSIVDMRTFGVVTEIPLRGAGYFVRSHAGTPYLWIDTDTPEIQLVEKDSLALLPQTLTPEVGKKAMHVEFTAEGAWALVSVWHERGAVVVYDAESLEEVARLPYAMPVGKYNARNKTRLLY
ncbi:MAG: c-type cytochrome, partial [Deltaproteobacteria bacterium]